MKKLLLWLIVAYQKTPSRAHSSCVFIPTCSEYTKEAIVKYGVFLGVWKGVYRIVRCHPWQTKRYDPLI